MASEGGHLEFDGLSVGVVNEAVQGRGPGACECGLMSILADHRAARPRTSGGVSATTHPYIQQALAARVIDLIARLVVLRGGEREGPRIASPGREHRRRVWAASPNTLPASESGLSTTLIGVTAPVDEHQEVTVAHLRYPLLERREARRTMNQQANQIALAPRCTIWMSCVQPGRRIRAHLQGKETNS